MYFRKPLTCFIQLIAFTLFSFNLYGQRVGVVEKTNYPAAFLKDFNYSNKYIIALRDLFEKKDSVWNPVYNLLNWETRTVAKTKTDYLLQSPASTISVKGVSSKSFRKSHLTAELFRVTTPSTIKLDKLPNSILKGFELKDIVANRVVTDKRVQHKSIRFFKLEILSERQKNVIYDSLIAQCQRCFERCNDTSFYLSIKKSFIENEVRVITDSMKLGRVNIPSGNQCFADVTSSYGGGVLNYIIYPNQEIKLLVTNTALIDVADYDNDGNFEYIFFKSWFNNYGYIMYFDKFQKQVVNEWSYH